MDSELNISEKWQMDEEASENGYQTFEILEMPCLTCKKRFPGNLDSCEQYETIPWEICVVEKPCGFYEKES